MCPLDCKINEAAQHVVLAIGMRDDIEQLRETGAPLKPGLARAAAGLLRTAAHVARQPNRLHEGRTRLLTLYNLVADSAELPQRPDALQVAHFAEVIDTYAQLICEGTLSEQPELARNAYALFSRMAEIGKREWDNRSGLTCFGTDSDVSPFGRASRYEHMFGR